MTAEVGDGFRWGITMVALMDGSTRRRSQSGGIGLGGENSCRWRKEQIGMIAPQLTAKRQ